MYLFFIISGVLLLLEPQIELIIYHYLRSQPVSPTNLKASMKISCMFSLRPQKLWRLVSQILGIVILMISIFRFQNSYDTESSLACDFCIGYLLWILLLKISMRVNLYNKSGRNGIDVFVTILLPTLFLWIIILVDPDICLWF